MSELLRPETKYDLDKLNQEPSLKFKRCLSRNDLNIINLGQDQNLSIQINILNKQINSVENSYGYHGESPLNDYPAPAQKSTLAQHDQLSAKKYQLELEHFFTIITPHLESSNSRENQLIATDKLYQLSKSLSRHQPEIVRQDLGDTHYVNWLEKATSAVLLIKINDPRAVEMTDIIRRHLDVTEEFAALNPLRVKFDTIPAISLLGLVELPNTKVKAVA